MIKVMNHVYFNPAVSTVIFLIMNVTFSVILTCVLYVLI